MVDLSKPNELWFTLEKLLTSTSARVESIINDLRGVDPDIKNVMRKTAWERIGNTHPVGIPTDSRLGTYWKYCYASCMYTQGQILTNSTGLP